jgi:hypothetical protein
MLLPGVTTITNRSRYLSMLCAALKNIESQRRFQSGPSSIAERRKAVEPFERLWALACVTAREQQHEGAADRLLGSTYAVKALQGFAKRGRVTPDYKLLKYQSRTGAVATYWTTLISGELIDADSGRITHEGHDLADCFPQPPLSTTDLERLTDASSAVKVGMPLERLRQWAESCHLAAAKLTEQKLLGEALAANDRREVTAQAIKVLQKEQSLPNEWQIRHLKLLRSELSRITTATRLGMPVVVTAIISVEQFHEAVYAVLESLLWWATQHATDSVELLCADETFREATERCHETARGLLVFQKECDVAEVRTAVAGLTDFARGIERCSSVRDVMHEIVQRHRRVQSGKLDGGVPKRDWVMFESGTRLLRPSPRFQRTERPPLAKGQRLTHPYRLEQFVFMLRENQVIPS